ncbi:MAG: VOC family protein [Clostridiales bacterium]|nr:VOC family protein [Eubacteriales bacterium]MDH7567160.1 VOC family protein [Clostridiales bacterium]
MVVLEHVGICAKDTISLKEWYTKLFGFKTVYDNGKEKPTFFLLMDNQCMLEIYPMEKAAAEENNKCQGIRHLAFGTDDIEKEYDRLLANHVQIVEGLKTGSNGVKTFFFRDMEGNMVHFIQREKRLY